MLRVCLLDHVKQGQFLIDVINGPARIENFVSAMLGISLRKHHQLDIDRIAPQFGKTVNQLVRLLHRGRKTAVAIGCRRWRPALDVGINLG